MEKGEGHMYEIFGGDGIFITCNKSTGGAKKPFPNTMRTVLFIDTTNQFSSGNLEIPSIIVYP